MQNDKITTITQLTGEFYMDNNFYQNNNRNNNGNNNEFREGN